MNIQQKTLQSYNELKKLELYDFNKLDNRISEEITFDTIIDHIYTLMVLIFVMYEPVNYLISLQYNFTYIPPKIFLKVLVPIEYILAMVYFKNKHFDYFYLLNYNPKPKIVPPNIITYSVLIISVLYTIFPFVLKINLLNIIKN